MRLFTCISILVISGLCCHHKEQKLSQEELIQKAYMAVYKNDTVTLFSIIDTSYCFLVYQKETIIYHINNFSQFIKECEEKDAFRKYNKKTNPTLGRLEYKYTICGSDKMKNSGLIFSFFFNESSNRISFIDFDYPKNLNELPALEPIPIH